MQQIRYAFRSPQYPVLLETDQRVIGALDHENLQNVFQSARFFEIDAYVLVESNDEGWSLVPTIGVVSPLTTLKAWNKVKVIDFFNSSLAIFDKIELIRGS